MTNILSLKLAYATAYVVPALGAPAVLPQMGWPDFTSHTTMLCTNRNNLLNSLRNHLPFITNHRFVLLLLLLLLFFTFPHSHLLSYFFFLLKDLLHFCYRFGRFCVAAENIHPLPPPPPFTHTQGHCKFQGVGGLKRQNF